MSESALKTRITEAVKAAMRAQDKPRRDAIRLIQAEIKRIEVDERIELDDARVLAVLDKMLKQRRDSIQQFEKAARQDLIDIEAAEVAVIQDFLPRALEPAEIDALVDAALRESGASEMKDMGKVMALLKPQVQGRADMGMVSQRIKARLA
ncbi:MAG: GatB/YqeY domain-containing protein [Gammaproteobacteria bacterium]|nr:GatB/YqeY domain-containing protein [Gammaproteobacteria bacterium]MBK6584898.1 GatB/YqeY domain-containing protein [Gammaproteobacteria bacterium]MBK7171211.1 GatB/YqeY domain-containing protein [Gammaproteobacteria bacterium]MBK9666462.1 GatB/YqeY domain-containing protein [Gammaproteobacteria bacterium]